MKVKVQYTVEYDIELIREDLEEYAGDYTITKDMIKEFCIDRAIAVNKVDKEGTISVYCTSTEYVEM